MPIPVAVPSGELSLSDTESARAEALLQFLLQVVKSGTTGATTNTPPIRVPTPAINPTGYLSPDLSSAASQLHFRQQAVAMVKSFLALADVSVTPAANKVPMADGTGVLDPGWLSGGVPSLPTFVDDEVVGSGLSGTVFDLANTPNPPTSLRVYRNGIRETGWSLGGPEGKTLTLDGSYPKDATADDLRVEYRY